MDRFYIVPTVAGPRGHRAAKYMFAAPVFVAGERIYDASAKYYGTEDVGILLVRGITPTDHAIISADPDVIAIPENLEATMTQGQVDATKAFYDSLNIPSGWINTSRTVLQVLKITTGIFFFNQKWNGLSGSAGTSPFKEGLNLNTQYNQLSELNKARLLMIFDTFPTDIGGPIDTSSLTATSTIGDAMRLLALTVANNTIKFGGLDL